MARRRTYVAAKNSRVVIPMTEPRISTRLMEWYADRVLHHLRREMTAGIFENPTGTSLRAWRYVIEDHRVRFYNREYIFHLSRGRKSQAMKWLEGKVIPIRVGNRTIFRTAKNVGRPNPKSKHGRLFYMKTPDKGKPYLGFIERAIDAADVDFRKKVRSEGGIA